MTTSVRVLRSLCALLLAAPIAAEELASCATPESVGTLPPVAGPPAAGAPDPLDCWFGATNPDPAYDPTTLLVIQVVVHVIMDDACVAGAFSDEMVASQVEILNEDFLALTGTPGANGSDTQVRFELAALDPEGAPTSGITRDCNTTWFNDGGDYWETLAWDPFLYLNLYTNTAGGARGYVPFLPAAPNAAVGSNSDRVVVNHLVFGRDGAFPPHDQGRTATHEIGHYLGLFHPYYTGCGDPNPPDCYVTGDLICDTAPDEMSHDKCPVGATSCGGFPVPIENYMELTDDLCMEGFTAEQGNRMRCTLEHYRSDLALPLVFADGFESGDTSAWSATIP
jgi:hypothetical protein